MLNDVSSVFLIQPHRSGQASGRVRMMLTSALHGAGFETLAVDAMREWDATPERVSDAIEAVDVVIADITGQSPNAVYELGYAHALGKPVILIAADLGFLPFDAGTVRFFRYDVANFEPGPIVEAAREAVNNPGALAAGARQSAPNSVFLSYSHRDSAVLERLLVHLRPLEREGRIDAWSDRRIEAGADWQQDIERALRQPVRPFFSFPRTS